MEHSQTIEIPLSKSKLFYSFLGSVAFVGAGFWFLLTIPKIELPITFYHIFNFIVGLASILFFGAVGIIVSQKLVQKTAGLIISAEGVTDQTSGISAGFVAWDEVLEITEIQVLGQKFVNLVVANPENYLYRQKNPLSRTFVRLNLKNYGTVVSLSANGLQATHLEMKTTLEEKFEAFKNLRSKKI